LGNLPHITASGKKIRALAEKLRVITQLSDDERLLHAWCQLATPDQRWQRMRRYLRSVRSSKPSTAKQSA
jgi:hypothetical protein